MNGTSRVLLSALALFGAGAVGAGLVGSGIADGAVAATEPAKPATFTMYANVDANGDLGSNYDATKAGIYPGSTNYFVVFSKPIGSCAAVAQIGLAGGPDSPTLVSTNVSRGGTHRFDLRFGTQRDDGSWTQVHEPFMLAVTCKS